MLKFNAHNFFWLSALIQLTRQVVATEPDENKLSGDDKKRVRENFHDMEGHLKSLELHYSVKQIPRLMDAAGDCTYNTIVNLIDFLQQSIADELEERLFLRVPAEKAKIYDTSREAFGKDTIDKFPSIGLEVEEATGNSFHS